MKNLFRLPSAILAILFAMSIPALATEWQATQGDVLQVSLNAGALHAGGAKPTLYCFGKSWPVMASDHTANNPDHDQQWKGWIGVDMKQKPGLYEAIWQSSAGKIKQQITVSKGDFRVSRIQVTKKMAVFDKQTLARIRREVKALKATYIAPLKAQPAIAMSDMPIHGIISTPFGAQRYVNGEPRSPHSGLDIAAPAGTPVKAPLAGKVLLVADMYLNGNTVAIGHGNGLVSVYSHMQSVAVDQGDWLDGGNIIGKVGATGRATGPHLHWGIRFNNARVNPESLLAKSNERVSN